MREGAIAVDNYHEIYRILLPKWKKTRIIDGGEDPVHEAGEVLLPRLELMTDDEYAVYLSRARFLPAFGRTVVGLSGTVNRKGPIYKVEPIEDYVGNITGSGDTLAEYQKWVLDEEITIGPCGTLVDYVPVDDTLTVAEAEVSNLRPNFAFYKAEHIINWKYDTINNIKTLVMVVLKEVISRWVSDFETEELIQYRVLRLSEEQIYTQQLYTRQHRDATLIAEDPITPLMNNEPLDMIPFFFHGEYANPPLYDLVTTNVHHYKQQATLNHALFVIGSPTPIFPGVDPNDPDKPQCIGPSRIIYLSDYRSKPYYLVYGGEGLASVEKEIETLKEDMAALGAQALASDQMVNETATKANIRNASDTSTLVDISKDVSSTLTKALQFFALWSGVDESKAEEVCIELSTDFNPLRLAGQDLLALVSGWQTGAYSKETLFWNLQQGEIIPGDREYEDEEEMIQNEMPAGGSSQGMTPEEIAAQNKLDEEEAARLKAEAAAAEEDN